MLGIVVVFIDIAILITIGSNPDYSTEGRWACFALVVLFSLPPLLWLFGGHLMALEAKWRHHCRAKRRARAAAARLKAGH
ncbi:hypothetical protein MXM08_08590 [Aeromonas sanarellii]|uniref:hypothetical protein n=1 Tax=Aeromonas sanarellii TaxID=633415 RepID=UPI002DB8948A|nr:hypothetical protein [Aeromonas sanarellii]MEB6606615.1 hypothetical protein [Aeromonas sanarellii]